MLEIFWTKSRGYTDLIPVEWFNKTWRGAHCIHYVSSRGGRFYPTQCSVSCQSTSLILDYGGDKLDRDFNDNQNWEIGTTYIEFTDEKREQVSKILWKYSGKKYEKADVSHKLFLSYEEIDDPDPVQEGGSQWTFHRRIERQAKQRRRKIREARRVGHFVCEGCGLDFEAAYAEFGEGACDVHHRTPLSKTGVVDVRLRDLAILCATCHRVVHRTGLDVKEFRARFHSAKPPQEFSK